MTEPTLEIPEAQLTQAGFTESGITRYKNTLIEYNKLLFDKSVSFGDLDKAKDLSREVTHEHVKQAAHNIANSYGKPRKPWWMTLVQFGSYLAAIGVGLASGYLDKQNGVIGFAVSFAIGAILFIIEKTSSNNN